MVFIRIHINILRIIADISITDTLCCYYLNQRFAFSLFRQYCFLQLFDLLLGLSTTQWPSFQIALKYMSALFLRFHYRSEETCKLADRNGLNSRFKAGFGKERPPGSALKGMVILK